MAVVSPVVGSRIPVEFPVTDQAGNVVDLTSATITCTLATPGGATVTPAITVTDAAGGICQAQGDGTIFDAEGVAEGWLTIQLPSGQAPITQRFSFWVGAGPA